MNTNSSTCFSDEQLDTIADHLAEHGYIILPQALDGPLLQALGQQAQALTTDHWQRAGIGRAEQFQLDESVRSDSICWIDGKAQCEIDFLQQMDSLRHGLNQRLFMGLFDYESHFAVYSSGQFYQKHIDALKGRSNRVLSTVLYLNQDWQQQDGGELLIYDKPGENIVERVTPQRGTLVIFLSEDFPHEVLPAQRTRFSIAGWFRINNNGNNRIDPAH